VAEATLTTKNSNQNNNYGNNQKTQMMTVIIIELQAQNKIEDSRLSGAVVINNR
jgi:hypothetical protein